MTPPPPTDAPTASGSGACEACRLRRPARPARVPAAARARHRSAPRPPCAVVPAGPRLGVRAGLGRLRRCCSWPCSSPSSRPWRRRTALIDELYRQNPPRSSSELAQPTSSATPSCCAGALIVVWSLAAIVLAASRVAPVATGPWTGLVVSSACCRRPLPARRLRRPGARRGSRRLRGRGDPAAQARGPRVLPVGQVDAAGRGTGSRRARPGRPVARRLGPDRQPGERLLHRQDRPGRRLDALERRQRLDLPVARRVGPDEGQHRAVLAVHDPGLPAAQPAAGARIADPSVCAAGVHRNATLGRPRELQKYGVVTPR